MEELKERLATLESELQKLREDVEVLKARPQITKETLINLLSQNSGDNPKEARRIKCVDPGFYFLNEDCDK